MNVWNGIGRITRDVELRFIAGSGKAVANGAIAVDKEGLSKDKREEMQAKGIPTADFPTFVVWGKNAENMAQLCKKRNTCIYYRVNSNKQLQDR